MVVRPITREGEIQKNRQRLINQMLREDLEKLAQTAGENLLNLDNPDLIEQLTREAICRGEIIPIKPNEYVKKLTV